MRRGAPPRQTPGSGGAHSPTRSGCPRNRSSPPINQVGWRRRAMTLISKSKPASQVTPTAVQFGWGGSPIAFWRTAANVSHLRGRVSVESGHDNDVIERATGRLQHGREIVEGKLDLLPEHRLGTRHHGCRPGPRRTEKRSCVCAASPSSARAMRSLANSRAAAPATAPPRRRWLRSSRHPCRIQNDGRT